MSNYELKKLARDQMSNGRYWMILLATWIVFAIIGASIPLVVAIVITGPLLVGYAHYMIDVVGNSNKGDRFELLFEGFKQNIATAIIARIIAFILIFLFLLLFIIPGIIKALSYSMVSFIIAEHPEIEAMDALNKSEDMMMGHKMRLFSLYLSFFWWYVLGILTAGLAFIFILPYIQTALANFYVDLRGSRPVVIEL